MWVSYGKNVADRERIVAAPQWLRSSAAAAGGWKGAGNERHAMSAGRAPPVQ